MYNTNMKKWWMIPFVFLGGGLAFLASAFCPVCAAGAVVGLGISRYLGVDDSITGIWIGGLLIMLGMWTVAWLKKRYSNLAEWWQATVFLGYYLVVLGPLWWLGKIGHPLNHLWGIDKFVLGVIVGTLIVVLAMKLHYWLKMKNSGKSYFLMQRTIFTLVGLLIESGIFYFLTR